MPSVNGQMIQSFSTIYPGVFAKNVEVPEKPKGLKIENNSKMKERVVDAQSRMTYPSEIKRMRILSLQA